MAKSDSPVWNDGLPPVALIAGPTASGKSALALALARALSAAGHDAVIINADASQVYADIPILSARPSLEEMAGIPHRLFGHIDGAEACDAARWASEAKAEIAAAHDGGAIPILVGGTGMYIDMLLRGFAPIPPIPEKVRAAIRALPVADAYRQLEQADPDAAARLKPQDRTRIARALEVVIGTGERLAHWQARRDGGIAGTIALTPLILLPPRDWLRDRCDKRCAEMFAGGAVDEVRTLLARRLDPALPVMTAIGVRDIAQWLTRARAADGSLDEALQSAQQQTRQYAKRQYTWFRNQPPADWPREFRAIDNVMIDEIVIKLRQTLLTG